MTRTKNLSLQEKKDLFIMTLPLVRWNVSKACKVVDIARSEYYVWLEDDPNFGAQLHEVRESLKDYLEEKQLDLVDHLDGPQLRSALAALAKDRGYGQEKKLTHQYPDGLPAPSQHYHLHLPPEPKSLADWEAQVRNARAVRGQKSAQKQLLEENIRGEIITGEIIRDEKIRDEIIRGENISTETISVPSTEETTTGSGISQAEEKKKNGEKF